MKWFQRTALLAAALCASPFLVYGAANEAKVAEQIRNMKSVAEIDRPKTMLEIAGEIHELPANKKKVDLADQLAHLATAGDPGEATVQAVADVLREALAGTPLPARKGEPAGPYLELAKLARYEHARVELNDPQFAKAQEKLAANDAEIEKADFALTDLHGKKYTLSALRGKVVLVNFWATDCQACRGDMTALDTLAQYLAPQGLVVLSITEEDAFKVVPQMNLAAYHGVVLFDTSRKVSKAFHVDGTPRTFVFDRQGKLVGEAIDQGSPRQFLAMLTKAGLKVKD